MNEEKKLFLLDAYALIFRAYYAFIANPIKNSEGFNTSTIFGFILTLDEVLRKESPSHIGVVFDPPGPTFRNELFPEYKANRDETPEDIRRSVPWIKDILKGYNIPVVELPGFEADDVIGTLAKKAAEKGFTVYMMTPDKDYAQLVTENVFMYKPARSGNGAEIIGVEEVKEKFGVENPDQVIDILGLWGDSADNVPGVPGIGEKTSQKLIAEYKSLENVLNNTEHFKGKQKENLIQFRDQAILSKKLVTIDQNVPTEFNDQEFEKQQINTEYLKQLFDKLEFRTLKEKILGTPPVLPKSQESIQGNLFGDAPQHSRPESPYNNIYNTKKSYHLIESENQITELIERIRKQKSFCFDTETTGLDPHDAELIGLALALKPHEAFYIPVYGEYRENLQWLSLLKPLWIDPSILKIGQNLKYDIRILKKYGMDVSGELFDTMIAHYLLQPEQRHNLNILSESYLNYSPVKIEELIGEKGRSQKTMDKVEIEKIKDYACEDADLTWQLYEIFSEELRKNNLDPLAGKVEMPLVNVLADIEHEGIKIDVPALKIYEKSLTNELIEIESLIFRLAGTDFNISSPKQLGEILFERLKIITDARKTKTKQYSTGEEVLSRLLDKHPIVHQILEYRSVRKLLSTYIEALPKLINKHTGRIHTSYNQALVATGRLSSNNPNLQNIPIREERGREIRKSFIPGNENMVFLAADYSQIELRLMAHLSNDGEMIGAFRKGMDIHTATAAKINNLPESEVSREMRSQAKTANFGIIYGISAFGLAERLHIGRSEARELIDGYFNSYPGVKKYMDECIRNARERGVVHTLMGRPRALPDIHSRNSVVRGVAERNAINAPIQGSAADIIKIAMVRIHSRLKNDKMDSKMLLQVHDELVFEVPQKELEKMKVLVKEEMEAAVELKVPLIVDIGVGNNWLEAH